MKTILEVLAFAGVKTPQLQRILDDEEVFRWCCRLMPFVDESPVIFVPTGFGSETVVLWASSSGPSALPRL